MQGIDKAAASMIAEAERLGKAQEEIDAKNRKRRAKGRKPLPDLQESKDLQVLRRRYRTGDHTAIDGADAMKLYELRKKDMGDGDPESEDEDEAAESPRADAEKDARAGRQKRPARPGPAASPRLSDPEEAVRMAAAARRVEDMKNGRIDHAGNWTDGQKLEGGDSTKLSGRSEAVKPWEATPHELPEGGSPERQDKEEGEPRADLSVEAFRSDLYGRLKVSFEALETTLSDLQGRVAEIVTASSPKDESVGDGRMTEFDEWLSSKTPVVFDVGGTLMTFDAVCVFHAPPCITIVSKIGSAKITPKPGAQLHLWYEMDGKRYERDPVTFLGTRFDLPMFGLSFVGFIRDRESDLMDVAAAEGPEA